MNPLICAHSLRRDSRELVQSDVELAGEQGGDEVDRGVRQPQGRNSVERLEVPGHAQQEGAHDLAHRPFRRQAPGGELAEVLGGEVDGRAGEHQHDVAHLALRHERVGAGGVVEGHVTRQEQRLLAVLQQQSAALQLQGELEVVPARPRGELRSAHDRVPADPDVEHRHPVDSLGSQFRVEAVRPVGHDLEGHEALRDVASPVSQVRRGERLDPARLAPHHLRHHTSGDSGTHPTLPQDL